jgi:hypothetical protein
LTENARRRRAVAPVAWMRAVASAAVSHEMLVPWALTSGSARQTVPPAQACATMTPFTHWANWSPAHVGPSVVHLSPFLTEANDALSAMAAWPLATAPVAAASVEVAAAAVVVAAATSVDDAAAAAAEEEAAAAAAADDAAAASPAPALLAVASVTVN